MPQIIRIQLEAQMIIGMHHLMRHGILHMPPIPKLVRTQQNPILGIKPSTLSRSAASTAHILRVQVVAQEVDVVAHEAHDGRVLQQPGLVRVTAGAVAFFVDVVFYFEIALSLLWRCCAA